MNRKRKAININLILYLLGRMVSDTGTSLQIMIIPLYIIDAGGSAATVGIFSFLTMLPALLISPFAGVIGDRLNRKTIMVVTDMVSSGVILSLGALSYFGMMSLPILMTIQVIISLLNGMFESATRGMLPKLVNKDELSKSNSMVASLKGISFMLGPVLGAVLYANFGITIIFVINGISFLLSAISETMIRYVHVKRELTAGVSGIFKDLSEGFRFIMENKIICKLSYFFLVIYLLVQPIMGVVLPLFFKKSLEYSDVQYGYLQAIIIFGMLIGSILVALVFRKDQKITKPIILGSNFLMASMLAFSVLTLPNVLLAIGNDSTLYFVLLAGVLCLFSVGNMFISVPVQSYIQRETPDEYMSRVFSIISMISKGGMPIGALIYGVVLNKLEMHWTVLGMTLLMVFISIIFLISLIRTHGKSF